MNQKVLSIILTAHNCETYLRKTLDTLLGSLAGLRKGYELILISDTSVDRTVGILYEFAKRHIQYTRLFQVNFCNIGKVRNFGVQQCSGDYITMVDGDDWLLAGALYEVIEFLVSSQPELLLTKLNEEYSIHNLNITWPGLKLQSLSQPQAIKKFLIHKDIQAHFIGQFVKRELLLAYPFPPFHCYEDAYLFPKILSHCQHIVWTRSSPYVYCKYSNSLSNQVDSKKVEMLVEATEEIERVFGNQYANLIACHWITILHRYNRTINNLSIHQKVIKRIKAINAISFLLDPTIRLSFKSKYIKIKNEK